MGHDYYQVLGVAPTADSAAIRAAFRRKAMECHPDRGGSHADMVLVVEAWDVLSDPARRARYDEARARAGDRVAQEAAAADARQARQRAEQYPRRWAEVEAWLNVMAEDVTGAQYGSTPVFGDIHFPTAGNSVSGCLFILIGATLGGVFLSTAVYGFLDSNKFSFEKYRVIGLALLAAPVIGGAWAGAIIHRGIGGAIKEANEQAARRSRRQEEREAERAKEAERARAAAPPSAAQESRVLACERCGQKLRVPATQSALLVTCKSCGHRFDVPGGGSGSGRNP
jgi:curved DNA-binding protein CbpA